MKTTWTGTELVLSFSFSGREIALNIGETKEFEDWVKSRVALIESNRGEPQ